MVAGAEGLVKLNEGAGDFVACGMIDGLALGFAGTPESDPIKTPVWPLTM